MIMVIGAISVLAKMQSSVFSPFTLSPDCVSHFIINSTLVLRLSNRLHYVLVTIGKLSSAKSLTLGIDSTKLTCKQRQRQAKLW